MTKPRRRPPTLFEVQDRVLIVNQHPWNGEVGRLQSYEVYGLGWVGWKVKLDNGMECYAQPRDLRKI